MSAQTLTLVAAVIAAAAAIVGAVVSSLTARRVSREAAAAALKKDAVAFRRERIATMTDMFFENSVELQALSSCCASVPWLSQTPLKEIHERGELNISRVEYATAVLRMNGEEVGDDQSAIPEIRHNFRRFCHSVAQYKDQIELGNIEPSGQAKPPAKSAEKSLLAASETWDAHLAALRSIVSRTCSRSATIHSSGD